MDIDRTEIAEVAQHCSGQVPLAQTAGGTVATIGTVATGEVAAAGKTAATAEIMSESPASEPLLRVMALHALLYCERLFYLEEVEEIRVADASVYAGRRLHDDLAPLDDESPERRRVEVSSERWGLMGIIDAVRRRDGVWVAYEHKRGRCQRGEKKEVLPWPSDRIQAIAYAVMLEEALGEPVPQARVRYHAENVTAIVAIDDAARADLHQAIARARELRKTIDRPPVHSNERMCIRCSLAPVCLPEEERLAERRATLGQTAQLQRTEVSSNEIPAGPLLQRGRDGAGDATIGDDEPSPAAGGLPTPERGGAGRFADNCAAIRDVFAEAESGLSGSLSKTERGVPTLFPSNRERQTLHVVSPKAYVSRSGESLVVSVEEDKQKVAIADIDALVVHGFGQVTTQAIHLCAQKGVSVQWVTAGGKFSAGIAASPGRVQQRLRQYAALSQPEVRLELTRRLVHAKVETQLRYLLRATRGDKTSRDACRAPIEVIREALRKIPRAGSVDSLRGLEGIAAKGYFACLPHLIGEQAGVELRPVGRSKHPPQDRFNCLLSFGYALVQSLVQRSLLAVGLEPALGFFHQPRTAAFPLVLDVMELFRTPLWEMPVVGSVNRGQWDAQDDFEVRPGQVWLTDAGRKKALQLFEQRLQESYKHPYSGQSLCYARMVELEARLLEKEWTGCPGLFAQLRIR